MRYIYSLKKFILFISTIVVLQVFGQYPTNSPAGINGKLKITGTNLLSSCGNKVQLRGMSSHGLQWDKGCLNSNALDVLVNNWQIDIFRLAMYVNEDGYVKNPTKWKMYIDNMVDECGKRGIYCIIDWHVTTPGDPNADIVAARDFWTYMATKHKDKKHVLYEICNEPSGVNWATVKTYANDIIPKIRAIDPNTVIIVGTPDWSSQPQQAAADKLNYTNIAYTLHFYAGEGAHSAYRARGDQAIAAGVCVFVSEFGTSPANGTGNINTGETGTWMTWMKTNNVSWCNWTFSDVAETSAGLQAGVCATGGYTSTSPSGTYIKGQIATADGFITCRGNEEPPVVSITAPADYSSYLTADNITVTANVTIPTGTISKVDFYAINSSNVSTLIGTATSAPYTITWTNHALGNYIIKAIATSATNITGTSSAINVAINVPQTPYKGTAWPIPGKIEGEDYDIGGQFNAYNEKSIGNLGASTYRTGDDVDLEVCTDAGAGASIGFVDAGEWLEYTVNVTATNKYNILIRLASGTTTTKTMHIELDGVNITGTVSAPSTGGYQNWQTVTISGVNLTAGTKVMRVFFETIDINYNYVQFDAANALPTASLTAPANNSSVCAGIDIALSATATDQDGTVSKVDFYDGTTLLGTDNSSPYTFTWTNAPAGSHTITAKATDNSGAVGTSSVATVTVNAAPAAPTATSPITYCQNATATALTATGTALKWYTLASGGTGSSTAPVPTTTTIATTSYYVSQTVGNCESPRTTIMVTVGTSSAAPTVTSPVTYCQNATATALTANGTGLKWYTLATGGTSSSTAPIPTTTFTGTTTYYVSQSIGNCESPRAPITVTVNPAPSAPTVTSPVTYCQNGTATALTANGTGLLWYTSATGGTGSSTAPVPTTASASTASYYVSQSSNNCESPRAIITVNVSATPSTPNVTSQVSYCQDATSTALTANGTGLLWYTSATGGSGSSSAPVPTTTSTGTTSYYVSQSSNNCESPRAAITVTINANPVATITSPLATDKFNEPVNVTVSVSTSGTTTNKVEFYNGTSKMGEDLTSPYSFLMNGLVAGNYTLGAVATGTNGCISTKSTVTIMVDVTSGINDGNIFNQVSIYPNPANEYFTMSGQSLDFEVYDSRGLHIESVSMQGQINFGMNYKSGIYLLKSGTHSLKVIKN